MREEYSIPETDELSSRTAEELRNKSDENASFSPEKDAFSIEAILRENRASRLEDWKQDVREKPVKPISSPSPKTKKSKRRKWVSSLVWILVVFAVSITLALGLIVGAMDYLGMGKEKLYGNQNVQIDIEMGTSMSEIGRLLKENHVIISETLFKIYTKLSNESDFQYGCHDFKPSMGYSQIVDSLQKPAKSEDLEITIKDTSTVDEIFELLEDKGVCKAEALYQAMEKETFDSPLLEQFSDDGVHYRLEGFLYPDTYQFYKNDSPKRVLQKLLNNLEDKFTSEMRSAMQAQGKTINEVLTMASIVELESCGYFDEMANIAAVFYNRLNNWPKGSRKLQSDPTMNYPHGEGSYNTYEIEGLPPGPLCNPTQSAIQAAISPTENFDYYFFVTDKRFEFYYSKTNGEHERTISNLKRKGLW